MPDERLVGDVSAARDYLLSQPNSNGKTGVMGFCSGGRQTVLAACALPFDAAVDCYGAFVLSAPPAESGMTVAPLRDRLSDLRAPVLGLFGKEDSHPSPAEVGELDELAETCSGSATTSTASTTPGTRSSRSTGPPHTAPPSQSRRGSWFAGSSRPSSAGRRTDPRPEAGIPKGSTMCTYQTQRVGVVGSGKGANGWFALSAATVYFDHPVHAIAEHTLNLDFAAPERGPVRAGFAVELTCSVGGGTSAAAIAAALTAAPADISGLTEAQISGLSALFVGAGSRR